jgi:hypothetical protein
MAAMLSTEIPVIQEIPHLEDSMEINKIPKIMMKPIQKKSKSICNRDLIQIDQHS